MIWSRQRSHVSPVTMVSATFESRLLVELVIPEGAEVVGTYGADCYAGSAAVTRNAWGARDAWHVGTVVEDAGVTAVVHEILSGHGLLG
ncbi:beta-galactosidase trimerization domain-containing protein [Actinoplanes xinjiangensis]|uniref:beta-galactosidase trimerization domain-containing protein n=1 Tax=Actinoplanes xinjiangensis TaxID=512350 RepID=UPI001B87C005|nr:beta-galactosidase trimerization domain-containing protein [Actinoplanes xinjiangensis]